MRCLAPLWFGTCAAVTAGATEAWFLPRSVDSDTLVYANFDDGDDSTVGGAAGGQVILRDNAALVPGRFGRGVRLGGPKQCVSITSSEAIRFGRNAPFTVELWVRPATSRGGGL